jgi:hypothetical protein
MYEPPANASLWQVVLSDEDGFVTTALTALDEYGPESHVEISIRRLSALPVPQTPGAEDALWRLPSSTEHGDIAAEWTLPMVDDIGELDHIAAQLDSARAMAAGLNGALANAGDWNRSTAYAAALHDLADRLATFNGTLPTNVSLFVNYGYHCIGGDDDEAIASVDALSVALTGSPGKPEHRNGSWEHYTKVSMGPLAVKIYAYIPAPAEEDPAVLKARIAELEKQLASGGAQ